MTRTLPTSYVVLDTETTGLQRTARLIELAAVKVIDGVIVDQRTQFCDPGVSLNPFITQLTGITDEMLCGRIKASELLPAFQRFLGDLPVVGHNVRFDARILHYEASLCRLALPLPVGGDTLWLAKQRVPGLPSYSLHALVDYFQIESKPTHRALADVYATQALFEKLRNLPAV